MASWRTHKCDSCDYSFVGSGKPDALFKGYTLPVVCSKCNEIYDRIVHSCRENLMECDEVKNILRGL